MARIGLLPLLSPGQNRDFRSLLGSEASILDPRQAPEAEIESIAVLDHGPPEDIAAAQRFAERHGRRLLCWQRGLIGGARPRRGESHLPLLGLFDPSALAAALAAPLTAEREVKGRTLLARARAALIGTGNAAPPFACPDMTGAVLVADQPGAPPAALLAMLDAALQEHGPETLAVVPALSLDGKAVTGPLSLEAERRRLPVLAAPLATAGVIAGARALYVWTAPIGFDGLMQGIPVITFGAPFYAGLGLTEDRGAVPERAQKVTIEHLAVAALVDCSRYGDPITGQASDAFRALDHVQRIIEQDRRFAGRTVVVAMKPWKRANVRGYLASRAGQLHYRAGAGSALRLLRREGGVAATWAASEPAGLAARLAAAGLPPLLRIEDGFLRSVGLGSNYVAAASLVLDRQGIYYDPTRPSDLETLLQQHQFSAAEQATARRLIDLIVSRGLTKYNIGGAGTDHVAAPAGAYRILVPGQVEDDASIRLGAPDMGGNLGLLRAVRAARPDAWIIYKPHPDVEAGNRKGRIPRELALTLADQVIEDASIVGLFPKIDAVHTMTSLVGFEALLRGLEVATYGLPFYAGWGLTEDRCQCPRRGRRRTVEELVAAALLLYPSYVDPETGLPCDVWTVVERLSAGQLQPARPAGGRFGRVAPFFRSLWQSLRG